MPASKSAAQLVSRCASMTVSSAPSEPVPPHLEQALLRAKIAIACKEVQAMGAAAVLPLFSKSIGMPAVDADGLIVLPKRAGCRMCTVHSFK